MVFYTIPDWRQPFRDFFFIHINMAKASKKLTPMEKLTAGYEKFIEGKKTTSKGKKVFEKTIKAASKPHGSK